MNIYKAGYIDLSFGTYILQYHFTSSLSRLQFSVSVLCSSKKKRNMEVRGNEVVSEALLQFPVFAPCKKESQKYDGNSL